MILARLVELVFWGVVAWLLVVYAERFCRRPPVAEEPEEPASVSQFSAETETPRVVSWRIYAVFTNRWVDGFADREEAMRVAWRLNCAAERAGETVRYFVSGRVVAVRDAPVGVEEEAR